MYKYDRPAYLPPDDAKCQSGSICYCRPCLLARERMSMAGVVVLGDVLPDAPSLPTEAVPRLDVGFEPLPEVEAAPDGSPGPVVDGVDLDDEENERAVGRLAQARWEYLPQLMDTYFDSPERGPLLDAVAEAWAGWVPVFTGIVIQANVDYFDTRPSALTERLIVKGSKRGNDVHSARQARRMEPLREAFFKMGEMEHQRGRGRSNMLFVTLTWDPQDSSVGEAGVGIFPEFNRFMASIRNEYGNVAMVRALEFQGNGYPHLHVLLIFEERSFPVYLHGTMGRVPKWRVGTPDDRRVRDDLAARWGQGFIDVQGVVDPRAGYNYITKYLVARGKGKDPHPCSGGPNVDRLTISMCWLFRMQQYYISRIDLIRRCITKNPEEQMLLPELSSVVVSTTRWSCLGTLYLRFPTDRPPPWEIDLTSNPRLWARVRSVLKAKEVRR